MKTSEIKLFKQFLDERTIQGSSLKTDLRTLRKAFGIWYEFSRPPNTFCGEPVETLLKSAGLKITYLPYVNTPVVQGIFIPASALKVPVFCSKCGELV